MRELTRRLPVQPAMRPPTAYRLAESLDRSRGRLAELESTLASGGEKSAIQAALRDERRKFAALDEAYQTEFASIEATLRDAGLGPAELGRKLGVWREFTSSYRRKMDSCLAAFDRLSAGALSQRDLAALRTALGEPASSSRKHPAAKVDLLPAPENPVRMQALHPPAADDPPSPTDLAETSVVKLTPEIRALAAELGNSASSLFAYVYQNIRWVPDYLGMQNSQAVLWSRRGSDADQCTLLIALLRAAGIPARYVSGNIVAPYTEIINWTGVKDKLGAIRLLVAYSAGKDLGDQLQFQHTWMEAWIDSGDGNGPHWIALSPSFKKQTYQPDLQLPAPVFDRAQFLSVPTPRTAPEIYLDQIHAAFARTFPGRNFTDLAHKGKIIPPDPGSLPVFPYAPVDVLLRASALPQTAQWNSTLSISDRTTNKVYLTKTFFLPEMCLQSLTISYAAATAADQAVINRFGGLAKVPAGMANLLVQFRLDDEVVATSAASIPVLQPLLLTDALTAPNGTAPRATGVYTSLAGEPGAVALVGAQNGDTWIGTRIDRLLTQLPTASTDSTLREILFLTGLLHHRQMQDQWESISTPLQYFSDYSFQFPFGTHLLAAMEVTSLFDRPFLATARWFAMDDGIIPLRPFNLNGGFATGPDVNVYQAIDAGRSSSECQTFERVALLSSSCTINAMQAANQSNIRILTLTQGNSATLLPTIVSLPADIATSIRSYLQSGATITIPERPVTMGAWTGFPWIVDWADLSRPSFFGLNQLNGAYTSGDAKPAPVTGNPGITGDPTSMNGTTCSDPVTVSNGNMFQQESDLAISSRGPAFLLRRTYNSFAAPNDGPFGYGWTHSYALFLRDNTSSVTFVNGSGGVYTFALQGGAYVSPPGLNSKLTKDAQGYTIRTSHGTQLRFDAKGVLQSITDRNQNAMKLGYDASGRLTTLTDALGRTVTLSYGSGNHIASIQDFSGRKVSYEYDGTGNLAAVTDLVGNRTAYVYNTGMFAHLLQTVTKPAGNSTSFEYYLNRQTARISDSAGRNMRFLYIPFSRQTIFIDAGGFATSFYYNALGNVTRVVKADGNYIDTAYTADAKAASVTDENGNITQFTYDAQGNLTGKTNALGGTVKLAYEPAFNMVTSATDAAGKTTTFEYDERGNLLRVMRPLGVEARFTYDTFGQVVSAIDGEGNAAKISYDASGNPVSLMDRLGNVTQLKFDGFGRIQEIVDALGGARTFQRDALGRMTQVTDALGNRFGAAYDGNGNLKQTVDANGRSTLYSYDALDNLVQVTDAQNGTTQYGYSIRGCGCTSGSDLVIFRSASGEIRSHTYDFDHRVTQATDAAGLSAGFVYNGSGDTVQKTDANGNTTIYEYDALRRLVHKMFPDGSEARFAYDANGNLTVAANANAMLTFTYDDLNRLTSVTDSRLGKTIQYTYDRNGRRTSLKDSEGGIASYSYDAAGNLKTLTNAAGALVQIVYDARNRPSATVDSNGIGASIAYDADGRVKSVVYGSSQEISSTAIRNGRNAVSTAAQFVYSYDPNGNRTAVVDLAGAHSFEFDGLNRLTSAVHPSLKAESYSYDGAGNRTSSAADANYRYDAMGRLISAEGFSYSYDARGNLTAKADSSGKTAYTYDYENRLTGISFPDGTTAAYLYDALGRRIRKTVNGQITDYLYDGGNILLELDGNGALQARYTHGNSVDQPLMMERGGQTYFYHADAAGSIAAVTDASGNAVCSFSYDAFGRTDPCQNLVSPFAFAGREYDPESGLYYLRARYYDPSIGRFITPDPLNLTGLMLLKQRGFSARYLQRSPQQLNAYTYARNNPLIYRDPSGLKCNGPLLGSMDPFTAALLASSYAKFRDITYQIGEDVVHFTSEAAEEAEAEARNAAAAMEGALEEAEEAGEGAVEAVVEDGETAWGVAAAYFSTIWPQLTTAQATALARTGRTAAELRDIANVARAIDMAGATTEAIAGLGGTEVFTALLLIPIGL